MGTEGTDRWRSQTTPMRRHPARRAWIAIALCLVALFVLATLVFSFVVVPLTLGY